MSKKEEIRESQKEFIIAVRDGEKPIDFIRRANKVISIWKNTQYNKNTGKYCEFCNPVREPILKDVKKSNKLWSNIAAFRWLYLVKVGSQWDLLYNY
jgi:hypothetical protein